MLLCPKCLKEHSRLLDNIVDVANAALKRFLSERLKK